MPPAEEPGWRRGVPAAFRPPAFASWASCPARGFRPSCDRPTALSARTRARFPCSARVRHGWDRVPSLPRGLRCLPQPGANPGRRTPPHSGRSLSPRYSFPSRGVPITGHQQGFTGIHPSQPFPRLCSPDGTGSLGLFPELRTRPSRTRPRTSGRERASGTARSHVISTADLPSTHSLIASGLMSHLQFGLQFAPVQLSSPGFAHLA